MNSLNFGQLVAVSGGTLPMFVVQQPPQDGGGGGTGQGTGSVGTLSKGCGALATAAGGAAGQIGPSVMLLASGIGVPVSAVTGVLCGTAPGVENGVGTFNSAAGPGPGGTQSLPPSLPTVP